MLLGTSHLCNLDRFISWTYLLIISQGAKVSESTIAAIESTSITQRCQRNSFPAPASQCAKAQDRLVSQWLLTAGGKTKICGIQSPNPSSRYLRYPLVLERVIIYSFTVYIIYIYRERPFDPYVGLHCPHKSGQNRAGWQLDSGAEATDQRLHVPNLHANRGEMQPRLPQDWQASAYSTRKFSGVQTWMQTIQMSALWKHRKVDWLQPYLWSSGKSCITNKSSLRGR